jgi:hypothetical protein
LKAASKWEDLAAYQMFQEQRAYCRASSHSKEIISFSFAMSWHVSIVWVGFCQGDVAPYKFII